MASVSTQAESSQQAVFIFQGTVQKLRAATMTSVPVTARTAIVRVDEIIQAPKLLNGYAGQEITVQLEPDHKVTTGTKAIFYTNNLIFGDSIAVHAIGHTDPHPASAARAAQSQSPAEAAEAHDLKAHLTDADLVVTGKVLSVSLARETGGQAERAAATSSRVSEHSAHWHEAVVAVSQVDKGQPTVKQLVVSFPSSQDVAWAHAPKFQPGQEGVFILHKAMPEKGARAPKRTDSKSNPSPIYTALHALDFQPTHKAQQIKALLRADTSNKADISNKSVKRTPTKKSR